MTVITKQPVSPIAHLTPEDIEQIGVELDAIRQDVLDDRGAADAAYIRKVVDVQRKLELGSRAVLLGSALPPLWVLGTAGLAVAKILENMEIGHNVMHGQWDWMNDPEIHSSNWEWDTAQPAEQWKHSHNYVHHQFTNVLGYDNDIGYGILRMAREQRWNPANLGQPVYNFLLAVLFQWGVALHDLDIEGVWHRDADPQEMKSKLKQILKNYPSIPRGLSTLFIVIESVYSIIVHASSGMVAMAPFTAGSIRTVTDTSAPALIAVPMVA